MSGLGRHLLLLEARSPSRVKECDAGGTHAAHALHRILHGHQGLSAGVIVHRPLCAEPVTDLFDCGEFLDVASFGDNEMQGFAPIDFYHLLNMGSQLCAYKAKRANCWKKRKHPDLMTKVDHRSHQIGPGVHLRS